ncbi:MAG: NfeD family protein, partial [Aeoliella sp.]
TVLLRVIAFAGIYFELHTPGLGIGGFVAAVALLLFFWSKALHGTVEWLEVLLFVGGVVSIMREIFVLPGFGIFGLGGALMVISALVLAGQRSLVPRTAEDFAELQTSLAVVASAGVLMIVVAVVLRRYLPRIPVLNDLMLSAPASDELAELRFRESLVEYSHLVGQRGATTTPLMPSGRAEIDGELVDVIAAGEMIERGTLVEVVSTKGSRVEVRAVRENT